MDPLSQTNVNLFLHPNSPIIPVIIKRFINKQPQDQRDFFVSFFYELVTEDMDSEQVKSILQSLEEQQNIYCLARIIRSLISVDCNRDQRIAIVLGVINIGEEGRVYVKSVVEKLMELKYTVSPRFFCALLKDLNSDPAMCCLIITQIMESPVSHESLYTLYEGLQNSFISRFLQLKIMFGNSLDQQVRVAMMASFGPVLERGGQLDALSKEVALKPACVELVFSLVNEVFSSRISDFSITNADIHNVFKMALHDRQVFPHARPFFFSSMTPSQKIALLEFMKKVPQEERSSFSAQLKEIITPYLNPTDILQMVEALLKMPYDKRGPFIEVLKSLFQQGFLPKSKMTIFYSLLLNQEHMGFCRDRLVKCIHEFTKYNLRVSHRFLTVFLEDFVKNFEAWSAVFDIFIQSVNDSTVSPYALYMEKRGRQS